MSAKEVDGAANAKKALGESEAPAKNKKEIIDLEEPIGDDGVNYDVYAEDADVVDTAAKKNETEVSDFVSERLKKRKQEKYFVRVEGDEKRKKIAERERKARERRTLREMRRDSKRKQVVTSVKNNTSNRSDASERSAEAELRRQRFGDFRERLYIIFIESWHKFVTLAVVLLLIAGSVWLIISIASRGDDSKNKDIPVAEAQDFRNEVNDAFGGDDGSYEKACERAEQLISEARENNDERLLDMLVSYVEFIINNQPSDNVEEMEKAHQNLMSASYEIKSNTQAKRLYEVYIKYDEMVGDTDDVEFYKSILQGIEDGSINFSSDDDGDTSEEATEDDGADYSEDDASSDQNDGSDGDDGVVVTDEGGEEVTE